MNSLAGWRHMPLQKCLLNMEPLMSLQRQQQQQQQQQNTPTLAVLRSCLCIVRHPCVDLSHHFVGFSVTMRDSCWKMCGLYFYTPEFHQNLWIIGLKEKRTLFTGKKNSSKKKKDQLSGFMLSMQIFLCQKDIYTMPFLKHLMETNHCEKLWGCLS